MSLLGGLVTRVCKIGVFVLIADICQVIKLELRGYFEFFHVLAGGGVGGISYVLGKKSWGRPSVTVVK